MSVPNHAAASVLGGVGLDRVALGELAQRHLALAPRHRRVGEQPRVDLRRDCVGIARWGADA